MARREGLTLVVALWLSISCAPSTQNGDSDDTPAGQTQSQVHPNTVGIVMKCGIEDCGIATGVAAGPSSRRVVSILHAFADPIVMAGVTGIEVYFASSRIPMRVHACPALEHHPAASKPPYVPWDLPGAPDVGLDGIELNSELLLGASDVIVFDFELPKTPAQHGINNLLDVQLQADPPPVGSKAIVNGVVYLPTIPPRAQALRAGTALVGAELTVDGHSPYHLDHITVMHGNVPRPQDARLSRILAPGASGGPLYTLDRATGAMRLHGIMTTRYFTTADELETNNSRDCSGEICKARSQRAAAHIQQMRKQGETISPNDVVVIEGLARIDDQTPKISVPGPLNGLTVRGWLAKVTAPDWSGKLLPFNR
jgi:hypothetical protein